MYPCSRSGLQLGDLLYAVNGDSVDNFGEVWISSLGVSLNVVDVLSRCEWNSGCDLSVATGDGSVCVRRFTYASNPVPNNIRFLDSVVDAAEHGREMVVARGIGLKTLRLDDVFQYKIGRYTSPKFHHLFKIMVCDIDSRTVAFQAKSIRPGSILHSINGIEIPDSWESFTKLLQEQPADKPLHITTEDEKVIIL